ncbi:SMI1/KNR4 family protein [Aquitalea magnusonii]|uniref:SMI1/KNR4 family protein n=1 Tax=Aquitalea magnusonii TaxID=332411 RepID=UPI000B5CF0E6|nr:SMI1/KNR4 family protein [Aquitalea magnusonii]
MIVPINSFGKASVDQIALFESTIGVLLPNDYRDFLLKNNGGVLVDCMIRPAGLNEDVLLDVMFGLQLDENLDLQFWLEEYSGEMPSESLLIGSDPGSNFILMIISGESKGVYYWDHTHFFSDSSMEDGNTYFICDDFNEFLNLIN